MPDYIVKVTYTYPVSAINAEDALSTVPVATRLRYANAEGLTEIRNTNGEVVLTAKLITGPKKKAAVSP